MLDLFLALEQLVDLYDIVDFAKKNLQSAQSYTLP